MLQFLKYVLATLVGLFLFFLVSLFVMVGIGSLTTSSSSGVILSDKTILRLNLNVPITEVTEENPFAEIYGSMFGGDESLGLTDIKESLRNAATDSKVAGIYLTAEMPQAGWASLEEIRDALLSFKESGKFIYAYGESYTEKGYYLASVADEIYLTELGELEWNGLSAESEFYKGALDKLDVQPVIFKVGEFKSAVEPFIRTDMSEASRLQNRELLESINNHFLAKVASARNLTISDLQKWAETLAIETPHDALSRNLITKVGYFDEFESALKTKLDTEKLNYVSLSKYSSKVSDTVVEGDFNTRVAVIVAEGEIVSGSDDDGVIASDKFVKNIKKLREDDKVKAIVLRINSPGGSALASDVMWREIKLTSEKKPVIASMSDVAASGGYYMAMACDTIVAQPNTITGSIGVFGMMVNIDSFMKNKLGITFDRVNTAQYADGPSATRKMTEFERNKIQSSVERTYDIFTSKAAEGRKMDVEDLKKVAQGRVWSGIDAQREGLVDIVGGINEAVVIAAKAASLDEGSYRVRYYPEKRSFMEDVLSKVSDSSEESFMEKLGEVGTYFKRLHKIQNMNGIQARMPYDLTID